MPEYSYICNLCYDKRTIVAGIHEDHNDQVCGCGALMGRDYMADKPRVHADSYHKAIHSDALAIDPSKRKEHERLHPDIKLDSKCRPVFDNFKAHEAYLEHTGHVKLPGKNKRKPVTK